MDEWNQARFCCRFNRKDGNVRCVTYIYNITVQAALKAIKAELKEHFSDYYYYNNKAPPPPSTERSAFFKLRSLSIIFKLRKLPRA